jgi:hypothetical protein
MAFCQPLSNCRPGLFRTLRVLSRNPTQGLANRSTKLSLFIGIGFVVQGFHPFLRNSIQQLSEAGAFPMRPILKRGLFLLKSRANYRHPSSCTTA